MTTPSRCCESVALAIAALALVQPASPPTIPPALMRIELTTAPPGADDAAAVLYGQHVAATLDLPTGYQAAVVVLGQRRCRPRPTDALPMALLLRPSTHENDVTSQPGCP